MKNENLEAFGKLLINKIRDETIEEIIMIADGRMKGQTAPRVRDVLERVGNKELVIKTICQYIIDCVIFNILLAVEEDDGRILYSRDEVAEPEELKKISDGLPGEIFENGWIQKFSRYPHSILGD